MKTINISILAVVFALAATWSAADSQGFKTHPNIVDFEFVNVQRVVGKVGRQGVDHQFAPSA